jgi:polar amino acid transport system permease protein
MNEVAAFLLTWTPFLAAGLLWNLGVTLLAVAIGTGIGAVLAKLRTGTHKTLASASDALSRFFRNVPTLALLFFAVFVLPKEFTVYGTGLAVQIPLWFKAALGLSGSLIGFTSESLVLAHHHLKRHDDDAAMLFVPTWGSSVMISFIASSTASLVGVSELISRSNSIIAATGTSYLIPVYLYCALFFASGCWFWMSLVSRMKSSLFLLSVLKRVAS